MNMHKDQERDYDYLVRNGATRSQAIWWCEHHPLGRSSLSELRLWLVYNNVGT